MRGGTEPTVTDADVVLGYLNPVALLGGRFEIDASLAHRAIEENIAKPLGLEVEEAALGIFEIVNRNMAGAISAVSLERGYDPRDFTMVAAGGQGPVHAGHLARELGIPMIIIPRYASTFCAFGALATDIRHDYKRSFAARLINLNAPELERVFQDMERLGYEELALEGVERDAIEVSRHLDMRYVGQVYEIPVEVSGLLLATDGVRSELEERLHRQHEKEYTYRLESAVPEIINSGVTVIGRLAPIQLPDLDRDGTDAAAAHAGIRRMLFTGAGMRRDVPIYDGTKLLPGNVVAGPAVVEEQHTTIVVPPDFTLELTPTSAYVMRDSV
jgi:N-methylhydantoinase A